MVVKLVLSLAPLMHEGAVCVGLADAVEDVNVAVNRLLAVEPVAETVTKLLYDDVMLPVKKDDSDDERLPTDDELSGSDV